MFQNSRYMMQCSSPPPLTDDQISSALDRAADPAVQDHLSRCPSCMARLAAARTIEQTIGASLRRWDCPPARQLADYHLGRVSQAADRAIVKHLTECASCRAEIEQLRLFLLAEEPRQSIAAPVPHPTPARGWLVGRMLPRAATPALRGAGAAPLMFEAGGATILLELQSASAGHVTMRGQLVADDQDRWIGALVEIRQSGALQATAQVDDLGGFSCALLPLRPTELRIAPPDGRTIVLREFELAD
jgi:hypothetical protein